MVCRNVKTANYVNGYISTIIIFYNYWNKVIISKSLLHYEHKDYPHYDWRNKQNIKLKRIQTTPSGIIRWGLTDIWWYCTASKHTAVFIIWQVTLSVFKKTLLKKIYFICIHMYVCVLCLQNLEEDTGSLRDIGSHEPSVMGAEN